MGERRKMMILSGIADEAATDIETQIKAHKELGWNHIELRLVDGRNVAGETSDADFDRIYAALDRERMSVTGFASRIANWSRHINDDFSLDIEDLKASIPRMTKLGTKYIRVMSWKGDGVEEAWWRDEAIRRMTELAKIAEDGEVLLCHENCTGWGGLSVENMREIRDAVDSPSFALLYDIGNTLSHGLDTDSFFRGIRNEFVYLHIKDVRRKEGGGPSDDYAYCGEGDAGIRNYLEKILLEDGYSGVISIEPHVAAVVHKTGGTASPSLMYESYLKYGRLLIDIVEEIQSHG
jgi:sugar phosphate isomerase/epimerase